MNAPELDGAAGLFEAQVFEALPVIDEAANRRLHDRLAQVDKIPLKRPVPLQIRHLRNGVSQTDTSHTRKPTATVITAPVPASCVRPAVAKNTIANRNTHPMTVIVILAALKCNGRYDRPLVSFELPAAKDVMLSGTALIRRPPGRD